MDIDLEGIDTQPVKKPIFKKKRILGRDKRIKAGHGSHDTSDNDTGNDDVSDEQLGAELKDKLKPLSNWKRAGGFRTLKKLKVDHFSSEPRAISNDSAAVVNDDMDSDSGSHTMVSAPSLLSSHISPLPIANSIEEDPGTQFNIQERVFAPPADIYDLDLPIDQEDEGGEREGTGVENANLVIKPLSEQIEFLQDHIFVLKDKQSDAESKISNLRSRIIEVKAKKLEVLKVFQS
ncbi:hypothetical protein CLIB1423_17S01244 [[Candida] railenensis]|uniref:Uncharacterized protein n=1 Tax=[Candida] railenensis TaxID=45579 RepID=A0A9P0QTZ9_9ASCO|nr:hypothetical protein CLIB1423_17S01244 [[Candida] railenensis]